MKKMTVLSNDFDILQRKSKNPSTDNSSIDISLENDERADEKGEENKRRKIRCASCRVELYQPQVLLILLGP